MDNNSNLLIRLADNFNLIETACFRFTTESKKPFLLNETAFDLNILRKKSQRCFFYFNSFSLMSLNQISFP